MLRQFMLREFLRIALIAVAFASLQIPASSSAPAQQAAQPQAAQPQASQQQAQNEPGRFDYYVLALSWSPSYCAASQERSPNRAQPQPQCGARPYAFVVHGLWPQHEKGYPSFCQKPSPRIERTLADSMLDLMPSPRLVFHQWNRHGTCAGVPAQAYFDQVRKARAVVKIPDEYAGLAQPLNVSPAAVADAFVKANPGLSRNAVAVSCDSKRLSEVRICLNKEFGFRDCGEVSRRACRRDTVTMPPVRTAQAIEQR